MGSSHSVYQSKPKDTIKNLQWALEESLRWEERAPDAKNLLLDQTSETVRQNLKGLELVNYEMDESRRLILESRAVLLSNVSGKRKTKSYLAELEKDQLSMNAQVALGKTASDVFAEGAAVKVATDENVTNPILSTAPTTTTETNTTNTDVLLTEGKDSTPFDEELPTPADLHSPEKKALIAKFLFIHSLVEKCILNAQYGYKLYVKSNQLHHADKKHSSPAQLEHNRMDAQRIDKILSDSLANFDRAYQTLNWANRDYELSLGLFKLEHQLQRLVKCSTAIHNLDTIAKGQLTLQLDEMTNDMSKMKSQFYAAIHKNDREAINLGFNYLDADENNKLSSTDLIGMSPRLVQLLKVDEKRQLKPKQLHTVFNNQAKLIRDLVERTKELEMKQAELKAENNNAKNDALIQKNSTEINNLTKQTLQASDDLHELYSFFLQAFAQHVFTELNSDDLRNTGDLDAQSLTTGLKALDLNQQLDPLATGLASKEAANELVKQDATQQALLHAKEFHTPNPVANEVMDKERPIYH